MVLKNFGTQRDGTLPRATTRLRQMLTSGTMVAAPFVLNAFHAKIAESLGFQAVYMTGFGTAAERGYPDVGLVTQTEMVENARYIANAIDIPVFCDADTGYGNAINVTRTIREYEMAGVAGCHIEDQVFPKKCGFFEGKLVVPLEEHVQKIRAALAARRDLDFVVIARTDALAVNGWEDVIRRCRAYREGGRGSDLRGWHQDGEGSAHLRQRVAGPPQALQRHVTARIGGGTPGLSGDDYGRHHQRGLQSPAGRYARAAGRGCGLSEPPGHAGRHHTCARPGTRLRAGKYLRRRLTSSLLMTGPSLRMAPRHKVSMMPGAIPWCHPTRGIVNCTKNRQDKLLPLVCDH